MDNALGTLIDRSKLVDERIKLRCRLKRVTFRNLLRREMRRFLEPTCSELAFNVMLNRVVGKERRTLER